MSKNTDKERIDEFKNIVEQFSQFIRIHIQKFSPQRKGIDPDDILQEVKMKIWKVLNDEKKIDNYASYIKKIVNSSVIDHLRKIRREESVIFLEIQRKIAERRSTYNKEKIDEKASKKILGQCVESLLDSRRKAVKLYLLNMTLEEIAEFLSWTPHKTRNLLYRGLNDLKKILQEKGIEYED